MKKLWFFMFFLVPFWVFSQARVEIEGDINVPPSANAGGITVFNITSTRGTVTDDSGGFAIPVALNDSLVFSSVQFQPFTVIVDKGVVESKKLDVEVREAVNELAEVVVRPYDLSGNVRVDVAQVKKPLYLDRKAILNEPDFATRRVEVKNYAMYNDDVIDGLNLINLFKLIFNKKEDKTENAKIPSQPPKTLLKKIYKDEFFQKYMDIEKGKVDEFIEYVEENGLSREMFAEGKELDLIEFLIEKSKEFKQLEDR